MSFSAVGMVEASWRDGVVTAYCVSAMPHATAGAAPASKGLTPSASPTTHLGPRGLVVMRECERPGSRGARGAEARAPHDCVCVFDVTGDTDRHTRHRLGQVCIHFCEQHSTALSASEKPFCFLFSVFKCE